MRDPYKVLGVKQDAGADEIKAAWRSMAKAVHPDHNQSDPTATERFAEVGRAYETLKDPAKRSRYDQLLRMAEAKQQGQTILQQRQAAREAAERAKAARANAERIMEELARANAQKARAATGSQQSESHQQSTESAEEVIERIFGAQARAAHAEASAGADKHDDQHSQKSEAAIERAEAAQDSDNEGGYTPRLPLGILTSLVRRITGARPAQERAPDTLAEATISIDDILKEHSIAVPLPEGRDVRFTAAAGMTEGHVVRLKGQGLKLQGMQRGDVVITVHIAPHERFTVKGFDIHTILPVTIENAVLGWETSVEGPAGAVRVTVPAWSGSDHAIRIPRQGLPDGNGDKGDLVVELRLMLWEKPDVKVTDLMRSMREGLFL
ncbi:MULTISPECIES: DnaJ C-terminal domain-containing protein [unclassified Sinorhizobium]|uniref:DnaJ C-terminal domain-containing protein n=1 Tax=unclassified Sinorhizobium TaxID=2613772 RepID=UPI003524DCC0